MDLALFLNGLDKYGMIIVFVVVFLEYLNLPGFPAGIILPCSGVWASKGHNFFITFTLTVLAGILGSLLLYFLGKYGGGKLLQFLTGKSEKAKKIYDKIEGMLEKNGMKAVFIAKLLPVARSIVGIPAGAMNLNLKNYLTASTLGIIIWNAVLFGAGYFLGMTVVG